MAQQMNDSTDKTFPQGIYDKQAKTEAIDKKRARLIPMLNTFKDSVP